MADVQDAETQYNANEFLDVAVQSKPIYISPNEVYSMHSLLSQHLEVLAPTRDDALRVIILELGGVPNLGTTEELAAARDAAITLELTNRFANVKGKSSVDGSVVDTHSPAQILMQKKRRFGYRRSVPCLRFSGCSQRET